MVGVVQQRLAASLREQRQLPTASLCVQRMRVLPFCDDYLFMFATREAALLGRVQIERTCAWLGLALSPTKCVWEPTQVIDHLGLRVDTRRGLFLVPPDKEKRLRELARAIVASSLPQRRLVPARFLAAFVGLAQSVYLAVPTAKLYLRELHDVLSTRMSWASKVRLTKQAIRDLRWWATLSEHGLGRAIWRSAASAVLHSDASGFAWGGVLDGTALAHGLWTKAERENHITTLELVAVLRNLTAFLPRLAGKRVHLHEDNMAVCYVLRELTTRSRVMMKYLRELWSLMQQSEIEFAKVDYIKSALNPADAPSRERSWDEWRICSALFDRLDLSHGPYTVDRFASQHTALCPRYNSKWADPAADGLVSAFSNDWRGETNWIHPPIEALDQVALNLRLHPCRATVIAPLWPAYSWFRELRECADEMEVLSAADSLADPAFLLKWGVRGPGGWSLVAFHFR